MTVRSGEEVVGDSLYQNIISDARQIAHTFETHLQDACLEIVPGKVDDASQYADRERAVRVSYLRDLTTATEQHDHHSNEYASSTSRLAIRRDPNFDAEDHALDALEHIYQCRGYHVYMKSVETGPVYDTWFPVLQNFFVPEPDMDPFRPYFGEHRRGVEKASEVYKQMLDDTTGPKRFLYESDDDYNHDEGMITRETNSFDGLSQLRKRKSLRKAIFDIAKQYGTSDAVWSALSIAFGIAESKVRLFHFIAETRSLKAKERERRRAQAILYAEEIHNVMVDPPLYTTFDDNVAENSAGAAQYFCFNCHIFACHRHKGENVEPFRPISDQGTMKRLIDLQRKRAKPCSRKCFLLPDCEQDLKRDGEDLPWTPEELALMREGGAVFEVDPCSLSVVIGTRSCRELYAKLQAPLEKDLVRAEYQKHITPRVRFSGRGVGTASRRGRGRERTQSRGRGRPRSRTSTGLKSTCIVRKEKKKASDEFEHETFVPCNHPGTCTVSNGCVCTQRGLKCESTCGCNFGRFESSLNGIVWKPPTESEVKDGVVVKCKNRFLGCKCKTGNCNSENCECYISQRLCNPDFCNHCDSGHLPHNISIHQRRCRNVDLITGRHKKTISGQSEIHGFGLFAGDNFLKGELVGHYSGRTIDPEIVDKMLRTSEARKRTYAFNLTDKYVIDGLCLGGKVRYINHSAEQANCEARFERIRGEGRIAIRTTKPVRAGQEFLFDYKITSGNDWLNSETDESDSDNDMSHGSPLVGKAKEEFIEDCKSELRSVYVEGKVGESCLKYGVKCDENKKVFVFERQSERLKCSCLSLSNCSSLVSYASGPMLHPWAQLVPWSCVTTYTCPACFYPWGEIYLDTY